ncbi:MAG: flagellar motor switch protein FliN [Armatimonadota bacterium]
MTNGGLSQEDIDRLLSGSNADASDQAQPEPQQADPDAPTSASDAVLDAQDSVDESMPGTTQETASPSGPAKAQPDTSDFSDEPGLIGFGSSYDNAGVDQSESTFPRAQASPKVRQVQFTQLPEPSRLEASRPIDMILDVKLQVTVELGRTSLPIAEILQLGPGAVIELDKLAGEPVDVLVNGKLVAKAEVVVIDENFGVRVTEIISPEDRIRQFA